MVNLVIAGVLVLVAVIVVMLYSKKKSELGHDGEVFVSKKPQVLKVRSSRGVKHYTVAIRVGRSGRYKEDYDFYDEFGNLLGFADELIDILFDNLGNEDYIEYSEPGQISKDPDSGEDENESGVLEEIAEENFEAYDQSAHIEEAEEGGSDRHFSPKVDSFETEPERVEEEPVREEPVYEAPAEPRRVYEAPEPAYSAPEPSYSSSDESSSSSDSGGSDD